ncbi:MAG: NfeD family protein [Spongiibacteraceae bacterium]
MPFEVVYWHWIILGAILIVSEMVLATFFILWFGVAAILISLLLLVFPSLSLAWQVTIWTLFSVLFAVAWFKFLKPLSVDKTKAGLSREAIVGETGQVIIAPTDDRRGHLRFSVPVLGNDEWEILSEDVLAAGDRVQVIDVSGNALLVKKA